MSINKISAKLAFALLIFSSSSYAAGPPASIEDLSWMTGSWSADLGPNTLEENWITPKGGSLAAMVRMSGDNDTSMFEVITIEEVAGSLILNIQQWDAGFVPRSAEAQKMELIEIGDSSVNFSAITEGSMKNLGYSREGDTFTIHLITPDDTAIDLDLSPKK